MKFENRNNSEFLKRRAEAYKQKHENPDSSGGDFMWTEKLPMYKMKDENIWRFLPGFWDDAFLPWVENVWVHYGIGVNNSAYFCLVKMHNRKDPICEESNNIRQSDPDNKQVQEDAGRIGAKHRGPAWIIDRQEPEKGPQLVVLPYATVAAEIFKRTKSKITGQQIFIDDLKEGYDVVVTRTGKERNTKYSVEIDRETGPSPLHVDTATAEKWLEYVSSKPLNKLMKFYTYEHIKAVMSGEPEGNGNNHESESETPDEESSTTQTETKSEPTNSDELSKAKLNKMDEDQLRNLISTRELDVDPDQWSSNLNHLRGAIALELGLE